MGEADVTLPTLVLTGPAAWYLRRHALRRQALAAADPDSGAAAGRQRRQAGWAAIAGIALLAVAGGVYAFSQTVPDGSEPPVPFDAATLGAGPVPTGRVQVRGTVDPDVSTGVTETTSGSLEAPPSMSASDPTARPTRTRRSGCSSSAAPVPVRRRHTRASCRSRTATSSATASPASRSATCKAAASASPTPITCWAAAAASGAAKPGTSSLPSPASSVSSCWWLRRRSIFGGPGPRARPFASRGDLSQLSGLGELSALSLEFPIPLNRGRTAGWRQRRP